MVNSLMVVGIVVLIASVWAWRRNQRWTVSEMPSLWKKLWHLRWLVGVALGIASYFMRYSMQGDDGIYTIYGIPFMAYAFDQDGRDYVGALTMPFLAANFVLWLLLPQLVFWLTARFRNN
jgi:hypothetical protein